MLLYAYYNFTNFVSMHPNISILIPTKNNEHDLIDCLKSIENLNYQRNQIEIIIWDNNSQSQNKEKIKYFISNTTKNNFVTIRFIENTSNYGVYTSRDELLKCVGDKVEFILSIDDDVILPPQLISELVPIFYQDSSIGIIGPRIVYDDSPSITAHGAGFINWWLGRYYSKDTDKALDCDYVLGCCMLIKRSVVDSIGGFDRDYYTSHGEVDFCVKAKQKGYRVLYCPAVAVRHRVERGGTQTLERLYYVLRNKLFVIKKNAPLPQKWLALAFYAMFWPIKSILDSFKRNKSINSAEFKIIVKAIKDGWLNRVGKRV